MFIELAVYGSAGENKGGLGDSVRGKKVVGLTLDKRGKKLVILSRGGAVFCG